MYYVDSFKYPDISSCGVEPALQDIYDDSEKIWERIFEGNFIDNIDELRTNGSINKIVSAYIKNIQPCSYIFSKTKEKYLKDKFQSTEEYKNIYLKALDMIDNDMFEEFKGLFNENNKVLEYGNDNYYPLIDCAAIKGNEEIFRFLKLNGFQITEQTCKLAIITGNIEIVEILYELGYEFVDHFQTAIQYHQNEMADWILMNYPLISINPFVCAESLNIKALSFCFKNEISGSIDVITQLKYYQAFPDIKFYCLNTDPRHFLDKLDLDNELIVDLLIENKYQIGDYLACYIFKTNSIKIFERFYCNQLLIEIKPGELVNYSIQYKSFKILEFLLLHGEKLDISRNKSYLDSIPINLLRLAFSKYSQTELNQAMFYCNTVQQIEILIELGSNINAVGMAHYEYLNYITSYSEPYEESILMSAVKRRKLDLIKYIIEHGAKINLEIQNPKPLIIYVIETCDLEIIQYLIDHGINVNGEDKNGKKSIDYVLATRSVDIMQLMLKHGMEIIKSDYDAIMETCFSSQILRSVIEKHVGFADFYGNYLIKSFRTRHDNYNDHLLLCCVNDLSQIENFLKYIISIIIRSNDSNLLDLLIEKGLFKYNSPEKIFVQLAQHRKNEEFFRHYFQLINERNMILHFRKTSPLIIACKYRAISIIPFLIDNKLYREKDLSEAIYYLTRFKWKNDNPDILQVLNQIVSKVQPIVIHQRAQQILENEVEAISIPAAEYLFNIGSPIVFESNDIIGKWLLKSIKEKSKEILNYLLDATPESPLSIILSSIKENISSFIEILFNDEKNSEALF